MGIKRRYEQHPDEGRHSDGAPWHVCIVHQGVTFVVDISKGGANSPLPKKGNKHQKTSQSQASEHLEMQVGVNDVLTTAAAYVEMCNQVLKEGLVAKNVENKALQEELANGQKQVEALKPKIYDLEQMMKHMHEANQAAMM
jgi:hypothetical protein